MCEVRAASAEFPDLRRRLEPHILHKETLLDSGKLKRLVPLLADAQLAGSRVLIFSQFNLVLDVLADALSLLGHRASRIDGSTPTGERQSRIDDFESDPGILCFLLSTRAGGVGLNLTAADTVVIFDSGMSSRGDCLRLLLCSAL